VKIYIVYTAQLLKVCAKILNSVQWFTQAAIKFAQNRKNRKSLKRGKPST